jgi:hypothetical protein
MPVLSDLRNIVASRFQDNNLQVFSAAYYDSVLNDAYADIIGRDPNWPFLELRIIVNVGAQAVATPLPANTFRVLAVFDSTNRRALTPYPGHDIRADYPELDTVFSPPEHFRLFGSNIELLPRPAAAVALFVEYYASPAALGAADVPLIPAQYHRVMVAGALSMAYEDDGNLQQAAVHQKRFEDGIQAMKNDLLSNRTGTYPGIRDTWYE